MQSRNLPSSFRKVVVQQLSTDFRAATSIVTVPTPTTIRDSELIVRNIYAGVNASDVNFTAGVYKPGVKPPFDCGFEALGEVVAVGAKASAQYKLGDPVLTQCFGAFSEYQVVPERNTHKVDSLDPRLLPLEVSGVTAALALQEVAEPVAGETALVTAAAGGTGQFAVQLLKHVYGCKVIGTASGDKKKEFLKSIGCDRVIDYKSENVDKVLKQEFPTGVNIVYESVGGELFETALANISVKGRIVVIGTITGYIDGSSFMIPDRPRQPINTVLLQKSASVRGFFLPHFLKHQRQTFDWLENWVKEGKIQSFVDPTPFRSLESIADAVDHLHDRQNVGKVIVRINP
jgi:NADPH-dependent curcumin reductase CurA